MHRHLRRVCRPPTVNQRRFGRRFRAIATRPAPDTSTVQRLSAKLSQICDGVDAAASCGALPDVPCPRSRQAEGPRGPCPFAVSICHMVCSVTGVLGACAPQHMQGGCCWRCCWHRRVVAIRPRSSDPEDERRRRHKVRRPCLCRLSPVPAVALSADSGGGPSFGCSAFCCASAAFRV